MLVILSAGHGFSFSVNLGDLPALLSGVLLAVGAMLVRQAPETSVFEQLVGSLLYGPVVALSLSLLPLAELGRPPSFGQVIALAPWVVLAAAGFLIPVMGGIYWGSRNVDPAGWASCSRSSPWRASRARPCSPASRSARRKPSGPAS